MNRFKLFYIYFIPLILIFGSYEEKQEALTGTALLEKIIEKYDPDSGWDNFSGTFVTQLTYPDSTKKRSEISLDLPESYFRLQEENDTISKLIELKNGNCTILLNSSPDFSEAEKEKYRLTCEDAKWMRDYYTYTLGLPMKLKDKGSRVHKRVKKMSFMNKEVLRLKISYDENVGADT